MIHSNKRKQSNKLSLTTKMVSGDFVKMCLSFLWVTKCFETLKQHALKCVSFPCFFSRDSQYPDEKLLNNHKDFFFLQNLFKEDSMQI